MNDAVRWVVGLLVLLVALYLILWFTRNLAAL